MALVTFLGPARSISLRVSTETFGRIADRHPITLRSTSQRDRSGEFKQLGDGGQEIAAVIGGRHSGVIVTFPATAAPSLAPTPIRLWAVGRMVKVLVRVLEPPISSPGDDGNW